MEIPISTFPRPQLQLPPFISRFCFGIVCEILVSGFHSSGLFFPLPLSSSCRNFYPARNEQTLLWLPATWNIWQQFRGFALNYVMFWKRNFIKLFGAVEGINQTKKKNREKTQLFTRRRDFREKLRFRAASSSFNARWSSSVMNADCRKLLSSPFIFHFSLASVQGHLDSCLK